MIKYASGWYASFFVITIFSLVHSRFVIALVTVASYPSCANSCISLAARSPCNYDIPCLCQNLTHLNAAARCVGLACSASDIAQSATISSELCLQNGVSMAISTQQYIDAANGKSVSATSAGETPSATVGTFSTLAAGEIGVLTSTTATSISGTGLTSATDNASPTASSRSGGDGGSGLSQSDKIALGCGLSIPLAALIVAYLAWRNPKEPKRKPNAEESMIPL